MGFKYNIGDIVEVWSYLDNDFIIGEIVKHTYSADDGWMYGILSRLQDKYITVRHRVIKGLASEAQMLSVIVAKLKEELECEV